MDCLGNGPNKIGDSPPFSSPQEIGDSPLFLEAEAEADAALESAEFDRYSVHLVVAG